MCSEANIKKFVLQVLENQNLHDYYINIAGSHLGNILFATATGRNHQIIYFAIKYHEEKNNENVLVPTKELFSREIFIYDSILPAFRKLINNFGVKGTPVLPQCYGTFTDEDYQVLILENLESDGFDLWDRKLQMPINHVILVLEAYGKWHALSFALKKLRPNDFHSLTKNCTNMYSFLLKNTDIIQNIIKDFGCMRDLVIRAEESNILEYINFTGDDIEYALTDMLLEENEYHVITHGDCWNDNFMFKSQNIKTNPVEVRVIDWQCYGLSSPVFDLSQFIYSCCDTEKLKNVRTILTIYYNSFSKSLKTFKLNADAIYSFEKLVEHWRKFSHYGMLLSEHIIKDCLSDTLKTAQPSENFNLTIENDKEFLRRVKNNIIHYANNINDS